MINITVRIIMYFHWNKDALKIVMFESENQWLNVQINQKWRYKNKIKKDLKLVSCFACMYVWFWCSLPNVVSKKKDTKSNPFSCDILQYFILCMK